MYKEAVPKSLLTATFLCSVFLRQTPTHIDTVWSSKYRMKQLTGSECQLNLSYVFNPKELFCDLNGEENLPHFLNLP